MRVCACCVCSAKHDAERLLTHDGLGAVMLYSGQFDIIVGWPLTAGMLSVRR